VRSARRSLAQQNETITAAYAIARAIAAGLVRLFLISFKAMPEIDDSEELLISTPLEQASVVLSFQPHLPLVECRPPPIPPSPTDVGTNFKFLILLRIE
jgi:hypothetical protein